MTYQVKINIFEGPLDLLLHLIQKNDLDIYDIPISEITQEYLNYIDILRDLNLSVAGEFLVMAATLMQIKAKTLLPTDPLNPEGEGPDPRTELVQKLLEYQKFKEAARFLARGFEEQRDVFYRGAPIFGPDDQVLDLPMTKLLEAFKDVLETAETGVREILVEEIPVEVRIREILDILETKPFVAFSELFPAGSTRKALVVTFLAMLELIRLKQVRVAQSTNFGEIHISRVRDNELELTSIPK
ncbi:MAG: Segregation and condensation protein A [Elusimicrobia bacterium]|nr:Segregation and condensation protein A [Elusimicrobiota bacterium]